MDQNPGTQELTIESVLQELTLFRESSKRQRKIPEELWNKAVQLCQKHPIGRIHRILRLGYRELKERVIRRDPLATKLKNRSSSPFVELKIPPVDASVGLPNSQYLIELCRADGARMRIYSSKNNPLNMNSLCSTFLKN